MPCMQAATALWGNLLAELGSRSFDQSLNEVSSFCSMRTADQSPPISCTPQQMALALNAPSAAQDTAALHAKACERIG